MGINTRLAHSGNDPHDYFGFVNPPVVHASTVLYRDAASMAARSQKYTYGTRGTPTTDALAQAIDALEGSAGTILVPSGLAAVTVPLLAFLSAGDHLLIVDSVYHPTRNFADTMLKRLGVEVEYYDPHVGAGIAALIRPNTKVVFTESPASNTFEVQDIPAIARAARASRRYRHDGQYLGDAAVLPPARPRRRHLDPCGDEISGRPFRHAARHCVGQRGLLGSALRDVPYAGLLCRARRRLPGVARPAHHGCAAGAPSAQRAGNRRDGWRANPAWRGCCIPRCPAIPTTISGSAISPVRPVSFPSCSTAAAKGAHAFLDALKIFGLGYSWGGYESLAVPVFLADRTSPRVLMKARWYACRSGSRMSTTSRPILRAASPRQPPDVLAVDAFN